ncbi:hypothetical protein EDB84DRAFT_1674466 [Lactarius hengduanensis]|nr:hypothetical protein EDB84DRAFT_1674466 [Lactarius hengduanensis]
MPGSPVVDIRNSFGAAFVGLLVSTTLLGLTFAQIFMDALHTIICAYAIYWYLVVNFDNPANLQYDMWAMNVQVVLSTVIFISVQLFVVSQLLCEASLHRGPKSHLPDHHRGVGFYIRLLLTFFLAKEIALKRISDFHASSVSSSDPLSAATVGDTLVATSMCWSLYRRRTGFANTDSIIMTSMAYSISSGLLTGLLSLASTISIVVSPSSMIWLAFFWATSKCYVNSMLAMLNSRDYVRGRQSTTDRQDNAYNISSIRVGPGSLSTLEHGRNKSDHDKEPTFEVPKPSQA